MYYIYILKLTNNKYYIGRTQTVKQTIDNHFAGSETEQTKINKPLITISIDIEISPIDIINTIKRYIYKFGVNNIYGDIDYNNSIFNISPLLLQHKKIINKIKLNKRSYDPLMDELLKSNEIIESDNDFDNSNDSDNDDNKNKKSKYNRCNCY